MIDARRIQVLHAVVTGGSITAAAQALGYTPSAISQQVAALERETGVALLERTGRGVRATQAGQVLSDCAALIDTRLAEAQTALDDLRTGRTGRVAVRYFASSGAALVAPAVALMRREHPGIHVDLKLADPDDPLPDVREGRADAALIARFDPPRVDGIDCTHLLDDRYAVLLPEGHRLADRAEVHLHDLVGEPWIGGAWPGPCTEAVLAVCRTAGFRPEFAVESEDYATARAFVAAGLGVSLVPGLALGDRRTPGVVARELADPAATRGIYAAVRTSCPPHPSRTAFLDALRRVATER